MEYYAEVILFYRGLLDCSLSAICSLPSSRYFSNANLHTTGFFDPFPLFLKHLFPLIYFHIFQ